MRSVAPACHCKVPPHDVHPCTGIAGASGGTCWWCATHHQQGEPPAARKRASLDATVRKVRRYDPDFQGNTRVDARWSHDSSEGGCLGCHARANIAIITAGATQFRLCARCLNTVNGALGGFR